MDNGLNIGGAKLPALEQVSNSGNYHYRDSDPIPWDGDWVKVFQKWNYYLLERKEFVVLLFTNTPSLLSSISGSLRYSTIGKQSNIPQGIYITAKARGAHGWKLLSKNQDYNETCIFIASQKELGALPAVVLGLVEDTISYYPSGLGGDGIDCQELPSKSSKLTWENLQSHLDKFATRHLNAHPLRPTLWVEPESCPKDAKSWCPLEHAEKAIQHAQLPVLRTLFAEHKVDPEHDSDLGRADFKFIPNEGEDEVHGVMELKVLRSFSHTGQTPYGKSTWVDAVEKGRKQVLGYARDNNASFCVLCAYDMRKNKDQECLNDIEKKCADTGVKYKKYSVLRKHSDDARNDVIS